jgi:hypothetical protein
MKRLINHLKKRLAAPGGQKMIRHLWILPAVGIVWTVLSYNVYTFGLTGRVTQAIEQYKTTEQQAASALQTSPKTADEMGKKNLFSGSQPAPSMPQCTGLLGSYALFGDQWYKAGDSVQGAKILAVEPTEVKILWQEKEQILRPFDVEVQYAKSPASSPTPGGQPAAARSQSASPPPMGGPFGGMDPRNMSPDQLSQMRDRFMNMSPDERRRTFEEMRGRRGQ